MILTALLPLVEKVQTKHSWLPEWYEIVFGGFAFLIVAGLLIKLAIPQLAASLKRRSERIATELERAREDRAQAALDAAGIRAQLGDVASERANILKEAEQDSARMVTEGRERIKAEVASIEAAAESDIATTRTRLPADLQAKVAAWAAIALDDVVTRSLDNTARARLVEDAITKIGAVR